MHMSLKSPSWVFHTPPLFEYVKHPFDCFKPLPPSWVISTHLPLVFQLELLQLPLGYFTLPTAVQTLVILALVV
jgi:hypothetical protein